MATSPSPSGSGAGVLAPASATGIRSARAGWGRSTLQVLGDLGREHALFAGVVFAYVALGHLLVPHVEMYGVFAPMTVLQWALSVIVVTLLLVVTVWRWQLTSKKRPGGALENGEAWRRVYARLRTHLLTTRVIGGFLLASVLYALLMVAFSRYKAVIPLLHPFAFDELFMRLDRWMHFGLHPWELLQPLLGYPLVTLLLDRVYFVWYFVGVAVFVWQLWSRDRELRARFLLTLAGCWIVLGTLLATLFSSVGPCYFAAVSGGENPYLPLMAYLHAVDQSHGLYAMTLQSALWSAYQGESTMPFAGIAAMPSLHVALPVLWILVSWRCSRALAYGFIAFAFLTVLGSVHLGWHYAVDGYVSLAVVPLLWWGAGHAVRWYQARTGALTAAAAGSR